MFTDTESSLQLILSCVVTGFIFGVFYDLSRAFRPKNAPFLSLMADALIITAFFLSLFLIGISAGQGAQRLYAIVFCLASQGLYFAGLSSVFRPIFQKIADFVGKILSFLLYPLKFLLKYAKKLCKISKNFFYSLKNCYTIKCKRKSANQTQTAHPYEKGNTDETEKGRYYY